MEIVEIKRYLPNGEYDYNVWQVNGDGFFQIFTEHREAKLYLAVNSGEFYDKEILRIFCKLYETEFNDLINKTSYPLSDFMQDYSQTLFILTYLHKRFPHEDCITVPLSAFYRIIL